MRKALVQVLADPFSKQPLELLTATENGNTEEVLTGELVGTGSHRYAIRAGIPRFTLTEDEDQKQTEKSFGFKWEQETTYDSPAMHASAQRWLVKRYGFGSLDKMRLFFTGRRRILDAGCGSGFSTSLWMGPDWRADGQAEWIGADISSAIDVAKKRLGSIPCTHFVQADILHLPFRPETFDTIFSEGVLHHTPSTERALKSLVSLLTHHGELLFYVYRKKAPIREFCDDYIRGIISAMKPEAAWETLKPLTQLGQALAATRAEVELKEDIPFLDIKAGRYDVQRLLYWHFTKMFWNDSFSFDENNHINFDWYHPRYAHRHTEEEVRRWCREAGLAITHFDIEESGFTVRATKN